MIDSYKGVVCRYELDSRLCAVARIGVKWLPLMVALDTSTTGSSTSDRLKDISSRAPQSWYSSQSRLFQIVSLRGAVFFEKRKGGLDQVWTLPGRSLYNYL